MPTRLVCGAVAALVVSSCVAQASEATLLADRAGFLLGHAHRCGAEELTLQRSKRAVGEAIAAFAVDAEDREAAEAALSLRILASALAPYLGDPLPSCATIRSQLGYLEQHRRPAAARSGKQREATVVQKDETRLQSRPPTNVAGARQAKARNRATTSREVLTAARRAALELKRVAQQERGRPPSI